MAGAFLVVHFGASACEQLRIGLSIDRLGECRGAAVLYAARIEPVGDALFDDLADRAELGSDRLGLADKRRQDDVLLALRVDEIAAEDLGSRL